MADTYLTIENIHKEFESFKAVDNVSFHVERGEVYGLLGPNGAGKTTVLRMIAGLMTPTEGSIRVDGLSPQIHSLEVKRKIGFATGSTGLYPRLNPIEFLTVFGRLYEMEPKALKEKIASLVERLGIAEFQKKQCGSLSTGQKQRVNIARSLLHEPSLLILDEPTSGLDIISSDFLLDFVLACKEENKAVVYSTHILTEVDILCDKIGIMNKGKLVIEGTTRSIQESMGSGSFAKAFIELIQKENKSVAEQEEAVQ